MASDAERVLEAFQCAWPKTKVNSYKSVVRELVGLLAQVRLEEAKWWTDPGRPNGPKALYPDEQERVAELERAAGAGKP